MSVMNKLNSMRLYCMWCNSRMLLCTPTGRDSPRFRCSKCNVSVEVTNPSYLDPPFKQKYDVLVADQRVGEINSLLAGIEP